MMLDMHVMDVCNVAGVSAGFRIVSYCDGAVAASADSNLSVLSMLSCFQARGGMARRREETRSEEKNSFTPASSLIKKSSQEQINFHPAGSTCPGFRLGDVSACPFKKSCCALCTAVPGIFERINTLGEHTVGSFRSY